MGKIRGAAAAVLLLAGFGLSAALLFIRIYTYESGKAEYRILQEHFDLSAEPLYEDSSDLTEKTWSEQLTSRNPDYAFWIWVPGTSINYPVVRNPVPGYYLNHTFSGRENPCGAIFCQEAENRIPEDNLILYGHNMKDGSMFADLKRYVSESFYRDYPDIWIYRQEEWQHYAIFSCRIAKEGDGRIYCRYFSSDEEKETYIDEMKENSLYSTEVQPQGTDSLLTLSTCFGKGKRVIVQAVLLCYTE